MKPADKKASIYFVFNKENIKEDPKFEVGNHIRISKYKNIFAKRLHFKKTVPWTYIICDLNGKEIAGTFHEKKIAKKIKKNLE